MIEKLGLQLYTIRNQMGSAEEIRESFRKLKKLGYDQGQTAGCQIPYAEFGQIAREEGIEIVGTHDDFDMMVNDFDKAWENHQALGTKIMGIGGLFCKTPEELRDFIEKANAVGAKAHALGGKFTYHNHSHEFIRWDGGVRAIDMLVGELDPETTSFVLDTYWVQHGGGDVRNWIKKLSGRIDILHLKDMGRDDKGPYITEIGNGNLYWEGILDEAAQAGVKYYVVEQDSCPGDPFESLRRSSDYIHAHFMK